MTHGSTGRTVVDYTPIISTLGFEHLNWADSPFPFLYENRDPLTTRTSGCLATPSSVEGARETRFPFLSPRRRRRLSVPERETTTRTPVDDPGASAASQRELRQIAGVDSKRIPIRLSPGRFGDLLPQLHTTVVAAPRTGTPVWRYETLSRVYAMKGGIGVFVRRVFVGGSLASFRSACVRSVSRTHL